LRFGSEEVIGLLATQEIPELVHRAKDVEERENVFVPWKERKLVIAPFDVRALIPGVGAMMVGTTNLGGVPIGQRAPSDLREVRDDRGHVRRLDESPDDADVVIANSVQETLPKL